MKTANQLAADYARAYQLTEQRAQDAWRLAGYCGCWEAAAGTLQHAGALAENAGLIDVADDLWFLAAIAIRHAGLAS